MKEKELLKKFKELNDIEKVKILMEALTYKDYNYQSDIDECICCGMGYVYDKDKNEYVK